MARISTRKLKPKEDPDKKSFVRETIEAVAVALLLALVIRHVGVQAFKIPSGSMKQTLLIGDHILVNKFRYGVRIPFSERYLINWAGPKRGDIIVFLHKQDNRDFIKRVVAIEGDTVEIKDKVVYINGVAREEDYIQHHDSTVEHPHRSPRDFFGPITIQPGHCFVMGDNRDNSQDSRYWGELENRYIKGSAFMIYWSWDHTVQRNWGFLDSVPIFGDTLQGGLRWGRLGKLIS